MPSLAQSLAFAVSVRCHRVMSVMALCALHRLYDADGTQLAFNDDDGDACAGSTLLSRISATLPAGNYAIMVEGYNSNEGAYQLNVECGTTTTTTPEPPRSIFAVTASTPAGACEVNSDGTCFTDGSGNCACFFACFCGGIHKCNSLSLESLRVSLGDSHTTSVCPLVAALIHSTTHLWFFTLPAVDFYALLELNVGLTLRARNSLPRV